MTPESPSFVGLFRRSRYYRRIADDDNSEAASSERFERERFAAAAVGFCLKHSAAFRRHFWSQVCRMNGDPKSIPVLKVEVEPAFWADILLSAEFSGERFVWVVECKTGAPLSAKQDPRDRSFLLPNFGYGWFLKNSQNGCRLRYIVLGAHEDLAAISGKKVGGISVKHCSWSALLGTNVNDPLMTDLLDSLGHLGISCFRMPHIRSIRVTSGFREAASAWEVLTALGGDDACGFRQTYWNITCGQPEGELVYLGAYLRRPPPQKSTSRLHRELDSFLKTPNDTLLWVGYESGPNSFRRSVWFYCRTRLSAEKVATKITRRLPDSTESFERDGSWCAIISCSRRSKNNDFEWFRSVLNAAKA